MPIYHDVKPVSVDTEAEIVIAARALTTAIATLTTAAATLSRLLEERASQGRWLPCSVAAEQIGGISPDWILSRIRDGRYKHGTHFVDASDGARPYYLVSVQAIRKELEKPPEKRSLKKK